MYVRKNPGMVFLEVHHKPPNHPFSHDKTTEDRTKQFRKLIKIQDGGVSS